MGKAQGDAGGMCGIEDWRRTDHATGVAGMQIEEFRVAVRVLVENPLTGFEAKYVKLLFRG
jgi:hypothetical protein